MQRLNQKKNIDYNHSSRRAHLFSSEMKKIYIYNEKIIVNNSLTRENTL